MIATAVTVGVYFEIKFELHGRNHHNSQRPFPAFIYYYYDVFNMGKEKNHVIVYCLNGKIHIWI